MLFLLQESAASASSPDGLERSSNVSARFVASFDQRGFDQQDGWCVASALNQRDSGSRLIPFEVIFQLKTGPFIRIFGKAWKPQTWLKSTSHLLPFTTSDVPFGIPDVIPRVNIVVRDSGSNGPVVRFHYIVFGLPRFVHHVRFCASCALSPDVPTFL